MLFNSTLFLVFLVVVVALFWRLRPRYRRHLLLLASYTFYWVWSVPFSGLLVLSTLVDYAAARLIGGSLSTTRRRAGLLFSLVTNLGLLCLFKYADFFSDSAYSVFGARPWPQLDLVLPLGISFYTFQTMSYTIDVYRGHLKPCKRALDVALYVSFFPQLVAGPIVRADELIPQLACNQTRDWTEIREGVARVLWGLGKKVFVADAMASYANQAYGESAAFSGFALALATYAFAIQIYCDFSGYSDIAIGSARLLGIRLPENFRSPYLSLSIREFWRRWHISLSTWLRDYLYIPLGGSRGSKARTYLNLMITMLLGGLWHGAGWNWVVWGGLQGAMMSIERLVGMKESHPDGFLWRACRWLWVLHFTMVSWVFFRADDVGHAVLVLERIASLAPGELSLDWRPLGYLALVLVAEGFAWKARFVEALRRRPKVTRWLAYGAFAAFAIVFSGYNNPEFVYFQF